MITINQIALFHLTPEAFDVGRTEKEDTSAHVDWSFDSKLGAACQRVRQLCRAWLELQRVQATEPVCQNHLETARRRRGCPGLHLGPVRRYFQILCVLFLQV